MPRPTIRAHPHPYDGVSWIVAPQDRQATTWLTKHGPQGATKYRPLDSQWPRWIVTGSQLLDVLSRARADRITITQP